MDTQTLLPLYTSFVMRGVRASSLSAYLLCLSVSSKPNPPLFLYPFARPAMMFPSFSCSSPRWDWLFSVFACRRECLNWRRPFQFVKGVMWFLKDELGMMSWKTFGTFTFATDIFFILLELEKRRTMRTVGDYWLMVEDWKFNNIYPWKDDLWFVLLFTFLCKQCLYLFILF